MGLPEKRGAASTKTPNWQGILPWIILSSLLFSMFALGLAGRNYAFEKYVWTKTSVGLRKNMKTPKLRPGKATLPPVVTPAVSPYLEGQDPPNPDLSVESEDSNDTTEKTVGGFETNQPVGAHVLQLQPVHWEAPTLWNVLIGTNGTPV